MIDTERKNQNAINQANRKHTYSIIDTSARLLIHRFLLEKGGNSARSPQVP
jgi:hypothetical protein